ncbi:dual-specificity RNA methyltransferase RlmN [Arenicella chitinivorans]|uniref:Dual-specificity RNA methyltransferase RlmN n=1 Tax=Arenicella chitinivorans TaxID=1329800 RepID=A0A918RSE3_9GAMM|nr:23S rRNA (adenine(2503)-C(2))-methyltransferase RlmN [Arenicella chitinivorans]GHA09186.1 dual-specificity RNA methyltransferase RlmN [Arenicella chitinivorans]
MTPTEQPINLMGLDRSAMEAYFASIGEKPFRASQVMKWIHQVGVSDFAEMTNLSKALRASLAENAEIRVPTIISDNLSQDGTRKWLLSVPGKSAIEMVFIPEDSRGTLCVSSQVGCTLNCSFCATGKQGYNRDLTTAEIIGQVWIAKHLLAEQYQTEDRIVSNVVMMGMGEPLMNFDNVVSAMNIMQDDFCFGLSKRRITLSTAGVVPKIDELKQACPVSLAVSLHAPNDELRNELVPLNRKYPIKELMAACNRYVADSQRARITFEYVMLSGVNDEPEHARQLANLMKTVPGKVNLIPFNTFEGIDYERSSNNRIHRFRDILHKAGVIVTIRKTRGDDIEAACGQLAGDVMDRTRRSEKFRQTQAKKIQ